ncbi:hypothetical protein G5B30_07030 [Sphingobacterium sp. SGG-5]|uniref:sensor histidine kinase n=1 Tax=Sphingobacterium sp. SGG-5 TaxID=2710881 RepID=UPI0013EC9CB5|nr:hypothetical protein [Sphingobacterium sp. SGG-5]NGM61669.1 hypothetical protein [Sphingobacterium sp. SGG-5]
MLIPEKFYHYFIPKRLHDRSLSEYDQLCTVVIGYLVSVILLIIIPTILLVLSPLAVYYYILLFVCLLTLVYIKMTGRFMLMLIVSMLTGYAIMITNCLNSGGILSIQVSALYLLLLTGFWADRRVGKTMIFVNLVAVWFLYSQSNAGTMRGTSEFDITYAPESFEIALLYHLSITVFFGIFFLMVYQQRDEAKRLFKEQQQARIAELDEAVRARTEQLLSLRQSLSRDFHDETGNILAAITRQASMLGLITKNNDKTKPIIDHIILNSERLYASSKDFLWSINRNSGEPDELFIHLTSFGQVFYNQLDIAFSAESQVLEPAKRHLDPSVSRHLVFMLKEAMTNTAKHSGCTEVQLTMDVMADSIFICLTDNGKWKDPDPSITHTGIHNMKKRATENGLDLTVQHHLSGTRVCVDAPLSF